MHVCVCFFGFCFYQTVLLPGLRKFGSLFMARDQRLHFLYGRMIPRLCLECQLERGHGFAWKSRSRSEQIYGHELVSTQKHIITGFQQSMNYLGRDRHSAWSIPSTSGRERKHPPVSVQPRSLAGSRLLPAPPEPCTALCPPDINTHTWNILLLLISSSLNQAESLNRVESLKWWIKLNHIIKFESLNHQAEFTGSHLNCSIKLNHRFDSWMNQQEPLKHQRKKRRNPIRGYESHWTTESINQSINKYPRIGLNHWRTPTNLK